MIGDPYRSRKAFMKTLKHLPSLFIIMFVVACFNVSVLGQTSDFAKISSSGSSVRFEIGTPNAGVTLTVVGPEEVTYNE